jgi:hypothetical protein
MRGLLVTPWFAAGAGFVIAAALALNSPHTVLTYRPNSVPCSTCIPHGALASAKPGVKFKVAKPVKHAQASLRIPRAVHHPAAVAGPEVGFKVVGQQDGAFSAIISLPADQAGRHWKLRFEIPGRRIFQVLGAKWQPTPSGYGGEASALTVRPGFSGHSDPSRPPGEDHSEPPQTPGAPQQWVPQQLRFLITAQGAPATPVACVLNGVTCHFG